MEQGNSRRPRARSFVVITLLRLSPVGSGHGPRRSRHARTAVAFQKEVSAPDRRGLAAFRNVHEHAASAFEVIAPIGRSVQADRLARLLHRLVEIGNALEPSEPRGVFAKGSARLLGFTQLRYF